MSRRKAPSKGGAGRRRRFGLGLAVGTLAAFVVVRRASASQRMPNLAVWQRALSEKRGETNAARLAALAQDRYEELFAARPSPAMRALRFHVERGILPGLAVYQTLLEGSSDRQAALAEMESLSVWTLPGARRLMPLLGHLRDPFPVFRRLDRWVMRFGFPADGWQIEPVEDSNDCIAFDIRRCFYLDTLTTYGAPELTPIYCARDDALFALLPPSITWERTMTLGRGDDRCDFRWCRAAAKGQVVGPTPGRRSAS